MAELFTAAEVENILEDTGGVLVSYAGQSTYGHMESWPTEERMGSDFVELIVSENSVVVRAGALPDLEVDPYRGVGGVGEEIQVGDDVWVVRGITPVSPEGGVLRIWLGR